MPPIHPLLALRLSTADLAPVGPGPDDLTSSVEDLARTLEQVRVDLLVLETADGADAAVVGAFLALLTSRTALVVGVPTATADPFHTAKRLQTLDQNSGGRAGWWLESGPPGADERDDRRALELVHVVRRLWRSWEPDALVLDAAAGRYLDPAKVRPVDHVGEFFTVRGPSLTPASPQWCPPVLAEAGTPGAAAADVLLAPTAPGGRPWLRSVRDAEEAAAQLVPDDDDRWLRGVLLDARGHHGDLAGVLAGVLAPLGGRRPTAPVHARDLLDLPALERTKEPAGA